MKATFGSVKVPPTSLGFMTARVPAGTEETWLTSTSASARPSCEWVVPHSLLRAENWVVKIQVFNLGHRMFQRFRLNQTIVAEERLVSKNRHESLSYLKKTSRRSSNWRETDEPTTRAAFTIAGFKQMKADDVVTPSSSPESAPIMLIPKKHGDLRFCVDYRRLNRVTTRDVYPMPRLDDIERLGGSRFFSTLDLENGFWQVPVAPEYRAKTAFITSDGLWKFKRLPFGLPGSFATFQRLMNTIGWTKMDSFSRLHGRRPRVQ